MKAISRLLLGLLLILVGLFAVYLLGTSNSGTVCPDQYILWFDIGLKDVGCLASQGILYTVASGVAYLVSAIGTIIFIIAGFRIALGKD